MPPLKHEHILINNDYNLQDSNCKINQLLTKSCSNIALRYKLSKSGSNIALCYKLSKSERDISLCYKLTKSYSNIALCYKFIISDYRILLTGIPSSYRHPHAVVFLSIICSKSFLCLSTFHSPAPAHCKHNVSSPLIMFWLTLMLL